MASRHVLWVVTVLALGGCGSQEPGEPMDSESPVWVAPDRVSLRLKIRLGAPAEQFERTTLVVGGSELALDFLPAREPSDDSPEAQHDAEMMAGWRHGTAEVAYEVAAFAEQDAPRDVQIRAAATGELVASTQVGPWDTCRSNNLDVAVPLVGQGQEWGGQYDEGIGWRFIGICYFCHYADPSLDRDFCF